MIPQTYLMIDILSVLVPLIASFHPASSLYKRWYALLPAIALSTLAYCLWDGWFTHLRIWGFNPDYLSGFYIANLPVEEVLFFICIPYACVFTFDSFKKWPFNEQRSLKLNIFNYAFAGMLIIAAVIWHTKYYPVAAFTLLALLILAADYKRVPWLPRFYLVYAILLIPFLIVNGLLTGTGLSAPVVRYNKDHIIGPRILTIPIEDVFYGMGLVLVNVWLYETLKKTKQKTIHSYSTK